MKFSTTIFILLFSVFQLQAQKILDFQPRIDDTTPQWAQLMYVPNPNVWAVDQAFEEYYLNNDFYKTTHTQYYKKWRRSIEPYINEQGFVEIPSFEEIQEKEQRYFNLSKNTPSLEKNQLPWQSLGPFETYSTEPVEEPVSWQVNVYTIDQSKTDPNILYAGTEAGGLFKTTDKGLTWNMVSANTMMKTVVIVKIHPNDPNIVYAISDRKLYKTENAGQAWEVILSDNNLRANDIAINSEFPDIILISAFNGLYRTSNGGDSWTQIFEEECYDIELKPDDTHTIYLMNYPEAEPRGIASH